MGLLACSILETRRGEAQKGTDRGEFLDSSDSARKSFSLRPLPQLLNSSLPLLFCMDNHRRFDDELAALERKLSTLSTEPEKFAAIDAVLDAASSKPILFQVGSTNALPLPHDENPQKSAKLQAVLDKAGIAAAYSRHLLASASRKPVTPLKMLPCAMLSESYVPCGKDGTLTCAACGLVGYCSKVGFMRSLPRPPDSGSWFLIRVGVTQ